MPELKVRENWSQTEESNPFSRKLHRTVRVDSLADPQYYFFATPLSDQSPHGELDVVRYARTRDLLQNTSAYVERPSPRRMWLFKAKSAPPAVARYKEVSLTEPWRQMQALLRREQYARLLREKAQLAEEVGALRRLVAKRLASLSESEAECHGAALDNRPAAAEMLASANPDEFQLILEILQREETSLAELAGDAKMAAAIRVITWLCSCRAVTLSEDVLACTDFGRKLLAWLKNMTALASEK